jgi:hypothetical protein
MAITTEENLPSSSLQEDPADEDELEYEDEDDDDDACTLGYDDERDPEERADGYGMDEETGVVPCECGVWPCRHNNPRPDGETLAN